MVVYSSPHPDVEIPNQSLPSFILEDFDDRAAQPALIDGSTGRPLTYGELQKAVAACAGGLAARQLTDSGAQYLLTVPPFLEKAQAAADAAGIDEVFVFGDAEGGTPFESLLHGDHPAPDVSIAPGEDLVALPYSSGTTGLSKGA